MAEAQPFWRQLSELTCRAGPLTMAIGALLPLVCLPREADVEFT